MTDGLIVVIIVGLIQVGILAMLSRDPYKKNKYTGK